MLVQGTVDYTSSLVTTLPSADLHLSVVSAITLNRFADSSLRALSDTVTLSAPPPSGVACAVPPGLEPANVSFGLVADNTLNGTLRFPLVLNFSHTPGTTLLYRRSDRALYLCDNGVWTSATAERFCQSSPVQNWDLVETLRDQVPDRYTFLVSYTCHNTEFSLLHRKCDSPVDESFVRTCYECIPRHYGCDCEATEAHSGFAADPLSALLAVLIGGFGLLLAWALSRLRPPDTSHQPLSGSAAVGGGSSKLGSDEGEGAARCQIDPAYVAVVAAAALVTAQVVQIYRSPGDPHTPHFTAATFLGLSVVLAFALFVLTLLAAAVRSIGFFIAVACADILLSVYWSLPFFFVKPVSPLSLTLFAVAVVATVVQFVGITPYELRRSSDAWLVFAVVTCAVLRGLLWGRIPCE